MSAVIDPAKLKVVELRNELQERGLDTKGNKAALVQRLKEALEKETDTCLPDTSIIETSSEEIDTSQADDSEEPPEKHTKLSDDRMEDDGDENNESSPEKDPEESPETECPVKVHQSPAKNQEDPLADKIAENGEGSEASKEATESQDAACKKPPQEAGEGDEQKTESKGEKRKRDVNSPDRDRSQKVRAKSPIKEDEPAIDNEKVQLNWYDSDLHLQVDKENFLSARPFTDGAFGYAWAGVRASHGVSKGKVWFEVKITEEIKWEDLAKIAERRQDSRRNQKRDRDKRSRRGSDEKKTEKPKQSKSETDEKSTEKKETPENGDKETTESAPVESKTETEKMEEDKPDESVEEKEIDPLTTAEEKPAEETPMETEETAPVEGEQKPEEAEMKSEEPEKKSEEAEEKKEDEEKVEKTQPEEPIPIHLVRIGWSLLSCSLQLGEEKFSYAYESTGKFVNDKQFVDYGKPFKLGDVIGAYLTIDDEYITIRYTVNGEIQPVAATLQKSEFPEENFSLYPHVLTRNCAFEINLGQREEPWFASPDLLNDYNFIDKIEDKVPGPARPDTRSECEVILMCGLPGSGKTHWVKQHIGSNQDKRYTVIGNSSLFERMTVSGNPLRTKFKGKWSIFVDRLQKCLNSLISLASQRRRNYIIDQTNVFPSAQRRKMRPFEGFKRKAVIVVVGDEEQSKRQALQESTDGKGVPESVILEMKAAMTLPEKSDWMDDVVFAELDEEATKEQVKKYNEAGKAAGYGTEKRFRGDRFHGRRNEFRGKGGRDRNFRDRRFDSRGPRWEGPRRGGGGGWRDNRDRRGPPPSRDFRGGRDYDSRDYGRDRDYGRRDSGYNRSRNDDRNSGGRWSGGGRSGSGWSSGGGGGGGWNQQNFSSGGYGNWGGSQGGGGGNPWKYGNSGQNYGGSGGGYGSNQGGWNYYGQYSQNQNWK